MKAKRYGFMLLSLLLMAAPVANVLAFPPIKEQTPIFGRRNMGGPRLGITYAMGDNALTRALHAEDMDRQMSQFGWHFEYQVIPEGGGPEFVVQFTPLLAGVEYGKFIPGATLAMGVRFPRGWEFGLGPNVIATTHEVSPTSLVIGIGKSINYGGVSVPLNLAYATNPDGARLTFLIGYAVAKRRS